MDKMKMETIDGIARNIEKLEKLFPNCVTETRGDDGALKKAVNFDVLRQLLSGEIADQTETYDFTWVGKKAALAEAYKPIRKTLRPCPEESRDWDSTQNLYIEGDNLEVLKLLQESYLGKVKMIYVDPPYNTGSDSFVYNDNYRANDVEYDDEAGLFDEEGNKVFKENNATNPRFHSDWCSMIYSRLLLARTLLTEDGVVFISIDDNEVNNRRKICDEIFGADSFVSDLIWQKKTGASDAKGIATITEHILTYVKNNEYVSATFAKNRSSYELKRYRYTDEYLNERGPYYVDNLDRGGLQYSDSLNYGIECPDGKITFPNGRTEYVDDGWIWKWSKEKIEWARKNNFIEFRKSDSKKSGWAVCYKNYLNVDNEGNKIFRAAPFKNLILDVLNAHSASTMKELFNSNLFNYSKPYELIQRLLSLIVFNEGDIIVDFFSGSATTAHAVMQLNAEYFNNVKMHNRGGGQLHYILVQLPEACNSKSEAFKLGYKDVCEIGKERIRRASDKIKRENPLTTQGLDVGFRVFKVDDSNMNDVYYGADDLTQDLIASTESNIKPDRTDLDLLFSCVLEWGLPLSLPYKTEKIEGFTIHNYNDGDLLACFEEKTSEKTIIEIAKRNPLRVVFRDSCFASVSEKINLSEIFKRFAPEARIKTL